MKVEIYIFIYTYIHPKITTTTSTLFPFYFHFCDGSVVVSCNNINKNTKNLKKKMWATIICSHTVKGKAIFLPDPYKCQVHQYFVKSTKFYTLEISCKMLYLLLFDEIQPKSFPHFLFYTKQFPYKSSLVVADRMFVYFSQVYSLSLFNDMK